MQTLQQLRDMVAAGTMAQIRPSDPMQLARNAQKIINAQPKKKLSIEQISAKLDWIKDEMLRLKQYVSPAQECDEAISEINAQISEIEKSLAWAQSQKNFQAESNDAAAVTQKRLEKLRDEAKVFTKRRDCNLKIAASIKARIEAYATPEEIAEWKESLKAFEAIERLNQAPVTGHFESFTP